MCALNVGRLKTATGIKHRLVIGELPRELVAAKREGRAYRRFLEDAVVAAKGSIDALQAHWIDTASSAQVLAAVCRWVLRERFKELKPTDILATSREILRAKQTRDAAVMKLGLDATGDTLDALYSSPADDPNYEEPDDDHD